MGTSGDGGVGDSQPFEGDSQPIQDGADVTEEDEAEEGSEGDGEDIPASQIQASQVIDLQTPEKEHVQDSQTPPECETRAPNECSPPNLADAKKELFKDNMDASMPPPKRLPKRYDTEIRHLELELQPL